MISWSTSDIAGLEFGDSHITVARVRQRGKGKPVVTHAGWIPYDTQAAEKDIAVAVKTLWHTTGIPTRLVCSSLRSSGMVMRYFKVPEMADRDLENALTLQAEEALQLSRNDLAVDWHIQPGAGNSERRMMEGVLSAAPLKDVERQLNILGSAGLDPVILDIRAMAVANLYRSLEGDAKTSSLCLVNMTPHAADVLVMKKSGGLYPYTVFCRASTWDQAPDFLCENIRDVLKYSEFKLDWERPDQVFLTGMVPENHGFLDVMNKGLNLPVSVWNPLEGMTVDPPKVKSLLAAEPGHAAMLTSVLGLALGKE